MENVLRQFLCSSRSISQIMKHKNEIIHACHSGVQKKIHKNLEKKFRPPARVCVEWINSYLPISENWE